MISEKELVFVTVSSVSDNFREVYDYALDF